MVTWGGKAYDRSTMKRRPWPIIILAWIHFLEPVAKIIFYGLQSHEGVLPFFLSMVHSPPLEKIQFFLLYPLAGLGIFLVKRWSYYLFLLMHGWILFLHFQYFPQFQSSGQSFLAGALLCFSFLNISVVSFFLLPALRIPFHSPKLRWWESDTRFLLQIPCKIKVYDPLDLKWDSPFQERLSVLNGHIFNFSQNGVGIFLPGPLPPQPYLNLNFSFYDQNFSLNAKIIHQKGDGEGKRIGLKFFQKSWTDEIRLRRLARLLRTMGLPMTLVKDPILLDFLNWYRQSTHLLKKEMASFLNRFGQWD